MGPTQPVTPLSHNELDGLASSAANSFSVDLRRVRTEGKRKDGYRCLQAS